MKKRLIAFTAFLLATFILVVGGGSFFKQPLNAQTTAFNVYAAISLTDALNDLKTTTGNPQPNANYVLGASGTLANQIINNTPPPADVFISAAEAQMNQLQANGLIYNDTRCDLLTNTLAIVEKAVGGPNLQNAQSLASASVTGIGIGDPAVVPAGQYAQQLFTNLQISTNANAKTTLYPNVRAVLNAVENGDVPVGIVYNTDALVGIASGGLKIAARIPSTYQPTITYPVAVTTRTSNFNNAKAWVQYLYSTAAQNVFKNRGFGIAGSICSGLQ